MLKYQVKMVRPKRLIGIGRFSKSSAAQWRAKGRRGQLGRESILVHEDIITAMIDRVQRA